MTFGGKVALVTGAASGIGLATARALAAAGAGRLVLTDRDAEALNAITLPCTLDLLPGDVRDEALWAELDPRLAGLDLAVVNAGIAGAGMIATSSLEDWRAVLSVNLDGAFLTLRSAMRAMRRRGGAIVVVASAAGIKAEAGVGAYGAAKAGLIQLARVAAKEGAPGIRVNAIAPGGVETPVWDQVPMFAARVAEVGREAAFAELAAASTPLGRYATADEIAGQIAFLLSDAAATITGAVLASDGGYLL